MKDTKHAKMHSGPKTYEAQRSQYNQISPWVKMVMKIQEEAQKDSQGTKYEPTRFAPAGSGLKDTNNE